MPDIESTEFDDELLSAYLDDELAPAERARVEERLAADPRARQLLDEFRAVSRTVKELPAATLGADLRETVLRRAERAMLVSSQPAPRGGLSEIVRRIPFGRSKRAWFWAGAALAAGLMLMVFQQQPARNRDLPAEVALRGRDTAARNETSSSLEIRSADRAEDEADKVAEAETAPSTPPSVAVSAPSSAAARVDASGGAEGGAAVMHAPHVGSVPAEDVVVVHINVEPEAFKNRAFDAVLVKNQIEVEEPTADEAKIAESSDVDLVLVEAAPAQVDACLAELKADHNQFLGIAVDEDFAKDRRSKTAQRSAEDLKQYNRGGFRPQQTVELGPSDRYYYQTNRGQVEIDRRLADKIEAAEPRLSQESRGAAKQSSAVRIAPPANRWKSAASPESLGTPGSGAAGVNQQSAAPAAGRLYGSVQQKVARRAVQKQLEKADMLQVLFVLEADQEPISGKPVALPATSSPAEKGLKVDER